MASGDKFVEVVVLGAIGALLVLVNGAADLQAGSVILTPAIFVSAYLTAGVSEIVLAILILVFLGLYWDVVDAVEQRAYATLVALLGAFSLWVGGGFIVGFLLVFGAGLLGVVLSTISESGRVTRSAVVATGTEHPPPPGAAT